MTYWKPTTEPNTCAVRRDPHTPVRVLATDLPEPYPVAYYDAGTDLVERVTASGRHISHLASYDLVPYQPKPKIEAWAVVAEEGDRLVAVHLDRNEAEVEAATLSGTVIRLTPEGK